MFCITGYDPTDDDAISSVLELAEESAVETAELDVVDGYIIAAFDDDIDAADFQRMIDKNTTNNGDTLAAIYISGPGAVSEYLNRSDAAAAPAAV